MIDDNCDILMIHGVILEVGDIFLPYREFLLVVILKGRGHVDTIMGDLEFGVGLVRLMV